MRLNAIFLILNIQLTQIFANPPSPSELSLQANYDPRGYECGEVFFTNKDIKNTLAVARVSIGKGYKYPERYQGKLYSETQFEEYFQYPIIRGKPFRPYNKVVRSVFRVIFTRNSDEPVGVIAKVANGDYTKCIQRGSTNLGPSYSEPENSNGYLCGHKFFTDETIHQSLLLAQAKVDVNAMYPSPYVGLLYPGRSGLLIWPIMKRRILYKQGKVEFGSYFLILNKEGDFIDVVIRGYSKNILRCIRARKAPKAPASDPYTKMFAPPPKSGYICGKKIFHNNVLEESAEIAKRKAGISRSIYPIEYSGPPFNQRCLIWPIVPDGSLLKSGHRGPFRLIMTPDYEIMSVAIYVDGMYEICERNTIIANKNHDTSSYHCNKKTFTHEQLVIAADEACERMNTLKRYTYPATYVGSGFKKEGPYLTYPVILMRKFNYNAGLHRVVVNTNCEVVGALTTLDIRTSRKMVKCHRLDDGPLPPDFFGDNAEQVFEDNVRS